jgi:ethanolamine utilization protein EutA
MSQVPDGAVGSFSQLGRQLLAEDSISLRTVGIDVGSATTQVVISMLHLARNGSRYDVVERELVLASGVWLTPFTRDSQIDAKQVLGFVRSQFSVAGISSRDVDSGVVILTGVALERENARALGEALAAVAGDFVSLSAGDALECVLAAHGSGAVKLSESGAPVLSVDVGGGTTKIALCEAGRVVEGTAVNVGSRLIVVDGAGRVERLEDAGRRFLPGGHDGPEAEAPVSAGTLAQMAGAMADVVVGAAVGGPAPAGLASDYRAAPLSRHLARRVVLSGGMTRFAQGQETRSFGDLGEPLAREVVDRLGQAGFVVELSDHGIRATVLGASQYSVQLSGSTIHVSDPSVLPLTNVPVLVPLGDARSWEDQALVEAAVRKALDAPGHREDAGPIAIVLPWSGVATFARLDVVCRGLAAALEPLLAEGRPVVVICSADIAGLVGSHLAEVVGLRGAFVCIDGIDTRELDFIDVGELLSGYGALLVTVKSLAFATPVLEPA